MNVLVVAPHPDDEVLGCGGVIARHAAAGDAVYVAIVTRGARELYPDEAVEQVRAEMRAAHEVLGVRDAVFLDFPAPMLDTVPAHEIADALRKVFSDLEPETVYIPHRGDIHLDHQVVHHASLVAARPIGSPVKRILAYETLSETEWAVPSGEHAFVPTVFVEIGAHLEAKMEALACFTSQMQPPPHTRTPRLAGSLAAFRGATVGVEAAEAFMLVRDVVRQS